MADETGSKESLQVAYSAAQQDLEDLERAATALCQELDGEDVLSDSSTVRCLRTLSGRMASCLKDALFAGAKKTLGVVSTHYIMNLLGVSAWLRRP